MKLFAGFLSLAFVSAAIVLSGCSGEKVDTPTLLSRATEMGSGKDWQGAKKLAQKAVKQDPNDPNALALLALCLENTGDPDGALDEISKTDKLNDRSFIACYTRGRLLFQKGRYDHCVAPLKQALALRPNHIETLVLLSQATLRQNLSEAPFYLKMLAQSDRFKGRPEPWNEFGVYYAGQRDYKRALQFLVRAETLAPDSPQVAINMAIVCDYGLRRPIDALSYYRKYLAQTSKNSDVEVKRKAVMDRVRELAGQ